MFGLTDLQEHMHKLESLFEAQKKIASMNNKQIDYFLGGIDVAKRLLNGEKVNFYHIEISSFNEIEQDSTAVVKPTATKLKPKVERGKGVIFIVTADSENAATLGGFLEEHHYVPHKFATPDEAMASLETLNPEVVMGGLEMIEALKMVESDVQVIFISENMTHDMQRAAFLNGAYAFVSEPYEALQVVTLCANAINKIKTLKLLETSVNYILYQFTDLDQFLKSQGKEGIRTALKKDLQNILEQRKAISNFSSLGE
jgi:FixJ family two-component response regulator